MAIRYWLFPIGYSLEPVGAMRTLIAGLSLVAVGFVLEGCGGGGSSTCVNSQVDLVSQSLAGTVTGLVRQYR